MVVVSDCLTLHKNADFGFPVFGSVWACLEVGYCTTSARFEIDADQEACNHNVNWLDLTTRAQLTLIQKQKAKIGNLQNRSKKVLTWWALLDAASERFAGLMAGYTRLSKTKIALRHIRLTRLGGMSEAILQ